MSVSTHRRRGFAGRTRSVIQASVLLTALAGSAALAAAPPAPGQSAAASTAPPAHLGQPFDVVAGESLLTVLVYRAGLLSAFGHDHVVACHCITGMIYVPDNPAQATFDLRVSVNQFTVDDPAMRAAEHSRDFAPHVSPSAQQAVRENMLSTRVLDAERYPDIVLQAEGLQPSPDGKPGDILARVLVQLRGQSRSISVPMHYEMHANEVVASGQFPVEQTSLGLTRYKAVAGALSVKNGLTVRFRLVAKRRG